MRNRLWSTPARVLLALGVAGLAHACGDDTTPSGSVPAAQPSTSAVPSTASPTPPPTTMAPPTTTVPVESSPIALLLGDSIFEGSEPVLEAVLAAAGWETIVEARAGAAVTGGGIEPVDWPARARDLVLVAEPDVVVVELGTNGCGDCASRRDGIERVLAALEGVPEVRWLNVREDAPVPHDPEAMNRALREVASAHERLEVVDLDARFRGHPEWLRADGIHPSDAGRLALAALVAEAIRPLLPDAALRTT